MAGEAATALGISYEDYLALERASDQRYAWLDGQVYAMAGGTLAHAELAAAVAAELRSLALACGCRVFSADAKVRVLATGLATYPDASVVCGPVVCDPADPNAMTNPVVLVEVLSDSTEAYDRGDKADHYRRIPSLRDYILVSQRTARMEVHTREGDHWVLRVVEAGGTLPVAALNGRLEVDRVYQGVALTAAGRAG